MKVALVYDRVNKFGGAERILLALHKIWPDAPLFTSVYNKKTALWANDFKVIPSFLQRFPFTKKNHEVFTPLMPFVFESFNFEGFDVVISITSEASKGIITGPKTLHLCYCLTPTRYLWSGYNEYFDSKWKRNLGEEMVDYLRRWDKVACQRPDAYIAISKTVQERIKKYYDRESEVIYPPVDTLSFWSSRNEIPQLAGLARNHDSGRTRETLACQNDGSENTKYFLVVSRLVKYKKVDLAIKAFNELGWNLKIVGVGREMGNLRKIAKENIEFLGQLTDSKLLLYYQNCQAVIFPQEEDFGIVPLEAAACGKPVVAFWGGGATETIIEGVTGEFFYPQTVGELVKALSRFDLEKFDPSSCRKQAEEFGEEKFIKKFRTYTEGLWKKHLKTTSTL